MITGSTGFVGSAVAIAVARRGCRVRALVRRSSPRENLAGLNAEIMEGDIRDPVALGRAMAGVRYAFHVAADYRLWARKPQEIFDTNVEGTRTVMHAAKTAGVERIVYTSSVAALVTDGRGAFGFCGTSSPRPAATRRAASFTRTESTGAGEGRNRPDARTSPATRGSCRCA